MKNFTKKIYLLFIGVTLSALVNAQNVSSVNETSNGACDGYAVMDSTLYTSWSWMSDSTVLQTGGGSIFSLCAGTYILEYTDSTGTYTETFIIGTDNPCNGFVATATAVNESADSVCDGSATVTATGGVAPYTYSWNNGPTTANISNLCAGTYNVTVMDNNGCSYTATVVVNTDSTSNPCNNFIATASSVNVSEDSICDGSVSVTATGGVAPYSYSWNNGATTASVQSLCMGTYNVTVMDNNGCSYTASVVVNSDSSSNPCNLVASITAMNETGDSLCDGSAAVTVTGGTPAYTYQWSNGASTSNIANLCAGVYTVTITDANACTATSTATVGTDTQNNPSPLGGYVMATDESTDGACDGAADVMVYGGVAPYTYSHSNGDVTSNAMGICAGPQTVMVTDANGDTLMLSYLVSTPNNTVNNPTYQDSTVTDTIVSDLIENCVIDYASVDSANIDFYNFFTADTVTVTWAVYDANGVTYFTEMYYVGGGNGVYSIELTLNCSQKGTGDFLKATDQIYYHTSLVSAVGMEEISKELELNVYPNPFKDNITISLEDVDTYEVTLVDISGKIIIHENYTSTNLINLNLNNLSNGQYIITVQNENSLITKKLIK